MNEVIIHLIATIKYRFAKAIGHQNAQYHGLHLGHGVRTPLAILQHLIGLTQYTRFILTDSKREFKVPDDWDSCAAMFNDNLEELQQLIQQGDWDIENVKRIIQGPLSDALTHIGQLAMMSRINGNPVAKVNYSKEDIHDVD